MRHGDSFYIRHEEPLALSGLDTVPYSTDQSARYITRIQVSPSHRQQGHGTALMQECCRWADETGSTLWLEIGSYGPLDNSQLYEWFGRFGFRGPPGGPIYRRPAWPASTSQARELCSPSSPWTNSTLRGSPRLFSATARSTEPTLFVLTSQRTRTTMAAVMYSRTR